MYTLILPSCTTVLKKAAMAFSEIELPAILSTVVHLAMQFMFFFLSFLELELHAILSTVAHLAMQCNAMSFFFLSFLEF